MRVEQIRRDQAYDNKNSSQSAADPVAVRRSELFDENMSAVERYNAALAKSGTKNSTSSYLQEDSDLGIDLDKCGANDDIPVYDSESDLPESGSLETALSAETATRFDKSEVDSDFDWFTDTDLSIDTAGICVYDTGKEF